MVHSVSSRLRDVLVGVAKEVPVADLVSAVDVASSKERLIDRYAASVRLIEALGRPDSKRLDAQIELAPGRRPFSISNRPLLHGGPQQGVRLLNG